MPAPTLQLGTVHSVDHQSATCRVQIGAITTGLLPFLARAGRLSLWAPPSVGEQCLLLSPEGDMRQGVVLAGLYSTAHPAPEMDANLLTLTLTDGARLTYDTDAHQLSLTLPSGGRLAITGDVSITGALSVDGEITAMGEVEGDGIRLSSHKHSGVEAGSSETGAPV